MARRKIGIRQAPMLDRTIIIAASAGANATLSITASIRTVECLRDMCVHAGLGRMVYAQGRPSSDMTTTVSITIQPKGSGY